MRIGGKALTPTEILSNVVLEIDDSGRIAAVDFGGGTTDYFFEDWLMVPGFVDLHVHGGGGSDFMDGTVEAVRTVARTHATFGTTSLLATTLTASRETVDRAIGAIVKVMNDPAGDEATIRGIHLEGPYICSKRRGAQPEAPIRSPDIEELDHWRTISGNKIKQITLAPELPGALPFIRYAADQGINVSIGHTDATSAQVTAAVDAGARQATHLFNAMSPFLHRAPGAIGALLADDRVHCELICDGVHVDPVAVKLAILVKGPELVLLITDAMSGTAMPGGTYRLGGTNVNVTGNTATFVDGTLAGSVLTMNQAYNNVRMFSSSSLAEASRMASANSANRIGIGDDVGTIEIGKLADLAVIDMATGQVRATLIAGRFAFLSR